MKTEKVKKVTKKVSLVTENGTVELSIKDKTKLIANIVTLKIKNGYSRTNLVNYVMKEWNVGVSRAYTLVKDAIKEIEDIQKEVLVDAYSDAITSLENIRQAAMTSLDGEPDYKLVLDTQKEINKVSGLYVVKTEVSLFVEQPLFSDVIEDSERLELKANIDEV